MNTRTAVGNPMLVCKGRTPGRGSGSAQYVMCVWSSIIPGIPYNLERSTTGTLDGTAELRLPTDLTRSPSTTASVITLAPSQSLPNRIAVTSGDFWELPAEFCAGTARRAGIASKIEIKTVAISVLRIDAVLPPITSEDVLHTNLDLARRPGIRLKDPREIPRIEVGHGQVVVVDVEHVEHLQLGAESTRAFREWKIPQK